MKRSLTVLAIAAFVLTGVAALASAEMLQTTCPVSGKAIDKTSSPHVDWQGQRIYFCCDDCPGQVQGRSGDLLRQGRGRGRGVRERPDHVPGERREARGDGQADSRRLQGPPGHVLLRLVREGVQQGPGEVPGQAPRRAGREVGSRLRGLKALSSTSRPGHARIAPKRPEPGWVG